MSDVDLSVLFELKTAGPKVLIDWCATKGLVSRNFECPKCKNIMVMSVTKRHTDVFRWSCRRKGHSHTRSVRKGTVFENSKLSLMDSLLLMYFWVYELPNTFMVQELRMGHKTIIDWKLLCRQICMNFCEKEQNTIGGEGVVVELGEAKLMCRKCSCDKKKESDSNLVWILGATVHESEKHVFRVIQCKGITAFKEMIETHIVPGTIILSDCWKTYSCRNDKKFTKTIAESKVELKEYNNKQTRNINETFKLLKKGILQTSCQHEVDLRLAEYVWRKNNPANCFVNFIEAIKKVFPPLSREPNVP